MTALLNNNTKFTAAFMAVIFLFMLCGSTAAQQDKFYDFSSKKQANIVKTLEMGLLSENEGLRRSSIYQAGRYQINELVKPLGELLLNETYSKERVLVLLTLYKIGGEESFKLIGDYVMNGDDQEAKKLAKSIVNEFVSVNPIFSTNK